MFFTSKTESLRNQKSHDTSSQPYGKSIISQIYQTNPFYKKKKKKIPHKHKVQIEKKRNGAAFTGDLLQQSKASPVNKGQPLFASYFSITGR